MIRWSGAHDKVGIHSLTVASDDILGRELRYIVDLIIQFKQYLALCPTIVNIDTEFIGIYRRQEVGLLVNDSNFLVLKDMI